MFKKLICGLLAACIVLSTPIVVNAIEMPPVDTSVIVPLAPVAPVAPVVPAAPVAPVAQAPAAAPITVTPTTCESQANAAAMAATCPDFAYVDISDQMAYMYRNGILVASGPCVTGNESRGYNTTIGFHQITFMDRDRTLRGSYGTAFVKYWMRFTSGGQGLHDAGWRSNFGGQIYKTNGSHGCVNLQRPVAQTMYSYAYVGMPVVVVP